jgi:hypothetical protein
MPYTANDAIEAVRQLHVQYLQWPEPPPVEHFDARDVVVHDGCRFTVLVGLSGLNVNVRFIDDEGRVAFKIIEKG